MHMIERCENTWVPTAIGMKFWPLNPRHGDIAIFDIAHHLSQIPRFTGACPFPYSVAYHCYLGSFHCERPLEFLLHDASEAYLSDISRPVKPNLTNYTIFETQLERIIAERFGLVYPWPACVKETDKRMLATERHQLFPPGVEWPGLAEPYKMPPIIERNWREVRDLFLNRFRELTTRTNTAYEG